MNSKGNKDTVRAALISADPAFRARVQEGVVATGGHVELGLETDATPEALLREPLTPIQEYDPQIVFMDLGTEPDDGIRLASILVRTLPRVGIVVSAPDLSQTQLLDAMRAGISEVVSRGSSKEELREAIDRTLLKSGIAGDGQKRGASGQVLAFLSPKGGTGCTTVAMNVGIDLHRMTGRKTLLVDLDLELGEIASFMGLKPRFNLVDLLKNFHRMDEDLLTSYIERHESGVHVLSAPFEPETGQAVSPDQIEAVISFLRHHYDYVVVDTSKSLAATAMVALRAADHIYPVTNLDLCSVRNLKRCLPILRDMVPDAERIRLIVNRYSKNALVSLGDLESTVGLPVYATLTNDFTSVIESLSTGKPLVLNGSSKYVSELGDLAGQIAGRGKRSRRQGKVLGRLFGGVGNRAAIRSKEAMNHA